jgi:branched-chain amino acid transport system substrate-binding protein
MNRTVVLFTILGTYDNLRLELKISSVSSTGTRKPLIKNRRCVCKLTSLPDSLLLAYEGYKDRYLNHGASRGFWVRNISIPSTIPTSDTPEDFSKSRDNLIREFDSWLDSCDLNKTYKNLGAYVNPETYKKSPDLVSFTIQTNTSDDELNVVLQKLPWNSSNLLGVEHYPNAQIVFGTQSSLSHKISQKLNAFVICGCGDVEGSNDRIDINPDLNALRSLPNIKILAEFRGDRSELLRMLRKYCNSEESDRINLLIFLGHSAFVDTDDIRIYINETEYMSPDNPNFRGILTQLINRGLILAFFNSCDGLGIANSFVNLGIPNLIVMKESVQDKTAQIFISELLKKWGEQNTPIDIAFQKAIDKLQDHPDTTPNGDFLPALFRDLNQLPLILPQSISQILVSFVKKTWKYLIKRPLLLYPLLILLALSFSIAISQVFFKPESICQFAARETNPNISCGEKLLVNSIDLRSKEIEQATNTIKKGLLQKTSFAEKDLENYLELSNNSETRIAIENFKAIQENFNDPNIQIKYIAVVVPSIGPKLSYVANSILKGVALKQQQYNNDHENQRVVVVIANDANDAKVGRDIAEKLASKEDIFAIVGHYSSKVTLAVVKTYNDRGKVLVSATATSDELSGKKTKFFFRVVPSTSIAAKDMAQNWIEKDKKIVLIFNKSDAFSNSLTQKFKERIKEAEKINKWQIAIREIDVHGLNFKEVIEKMDEAKNDIRFNSIALFADAYTGSTEENEIFPKIIEKNNNELPILANTSIYDLYAAVNISKDLKEDKELKYGSPRLYDKVVMSLPWDYSDRNHRFPNLSIQKNYEKLPNLPEWLVKNSQVDTLNQRTAFAYDATSVVLKALDAAKNSSDIQRKLTDNFSRKGVKGITGMIKFKDGDRNEQMNSLITPCNESDCHGFKPYKRK